MKIYVIIGTLDYAGGTNLEILKSKPSDEKLQSIRENHPWYDDYEVQEREI